MYISILRCQNGVFGGCEKEKLKLHFNVIFFISTTKHHMEIIEGSIISIFSDFPRNTLDRFCELFNLLLSSPINEEVLYEVVVRGELMGVEKWIQTENGNVYVFHQIDTNWQQVFTAKLDPLLCFSHGLYQTLNLEWGKVMNYPFAYVPNPSRMGGIKKILIRDALLGSGCMFLLVLYESGKLIQCGGFSDGPITDKLGSVFTILPHPHKNDSETYVVYKRGDKYVYMIYGPKHNRTDQVHNLEVFHANCSHTKSARKLVTVKHD